MVDSSLLPQGNYGIAAGTVTGNASGSLIGGGNKNKNNNNRNNKNKNNNKNNKNENNKNNKNGGTYFGPPGPHFGGNYIPTIHANLDMTANSMTVAGGHKKNQNKQTNKIEEKHEYKGGNYTVHVGPRGGKYIMHKGSKIYI